MKIYYQNNRNEKIYFDKKPFLMLSKTDLFDFGWDTSTANGKTTIGKSRKAENRTISILICSENGRGCLENYKKLVDVTDIDTVMETPGRLFVGSGYLECWISAVKISDDYTGSRSMECSFTVTPRENIWFYQTMFPFRTGLSTSGNNLDFPYDYPFDYASGSSNEQLLNDAFSDTDFEITVYGGCENPEIYVSGHKYAVNCQLDTGEYLKINSSTKKIYKVKVNGEIINQYYLKDREYDIFRKIAAGKNMVTWNGLFGFDITLLEKRSEPRWT